MEYLQASTYTKLDFVLEPIAANKWAFINVCLGYAVCIIKRFTKSRFSKKEMHCKASNENCTNITFVRRKNHNKMKFFLQLKLYDDVSTFNTIFFSQIGCGLTYTAGGFVWCDRPSYLVKQPQEKWACDFHDDAPPLSFQLQVAEVNFSNFN